MKGILEFKLPQDDEDFRTAQDGWKWKSAMRELDEYLRNKLKVEDLNPYEEGVCKAFRTKLYELVDGQGVSVWD